MGWEAAVSVCLCHALPFLRDTPWVNKHFLQFFPFAAPSLSCCPPTWPKEPVASHSCEGGFCCHGLSTRPPPDHHPLLWLGLQLYGREFLSRVSNKELGFPSLTHTIPKNPQSLSSPGTGGCLPGGEAEREEVREKAAPRLSVTMACVPGCLCPVCWRGMRGGGREEPLQPTPRAGQALSQGRKGLAGACVRVVGTPLCKHGCGGRTVPQDKFTGS